MSRDISELDGQTMEVQGTEVQDRGGFFDSIGNFISGVGSAIGSAFTFGSPDCDVQKIHIPHLSMDDAQIVVDVLITNPNPIPIPLVDIDYLIESEGRKLVSGVIPDAGTIHAHGSELVKIPVNLIFKDIVDTFEDINPGQIVKYRLNLTLIIDVPVFGRFKIPLDKTGEIPIPEKPDVDLEKVKFKHLDFHETQAILHIKVENFNPFSLGVNKLDFDISFGDVSVGTAKYDEGTAVIEQGADGEGPTGIGRLQVPITIRPKDFGSAVWDLIRGKSTGYTLKGSAEVDTPFGAMLLPFTKEGGKTKFKKEDEDDSDEE